MSLLSWLSSMWTIGYWKWQFKFKYYINHFNINSSIILCLMQIYANDSHSNHLGFDLLGRISSSILMNYCLLIFIVLSTYKNAWSCCKTISYYCVTLCRWSAKQTVPLSVLARNQTKVWARDLRRDQKSVRERE